jgi:alpha-beta hydrolase superfamily lysophospholipase
MIPCDPQPIFFGPTARPLFGWIHRSEESRTGTGVVLCPPLWQEDMNAHRTMRHLAFALSKAGFPALRFDYDGCGDSAGDDWDGDRVDAWVDSVRAAIQALRSSEQLDRVCLLGIRAGAMLATLAAANRNDVAGVIAIAPVFSGRILVRELVAMSIVGGWRRGAKGSELRATSSPLTDGALEAAGFGMTSQTRNSISKIDLLDGQSLPCPLFVIDRDDVSGSARWTEHMQALGVPLQRVALPGYLAMMTDPAFTKVPALIVEQALNWVRQCAGSTTTATPGASAAPAMGGRPYAHLAPAFDGGSPVLETAIVRRDDGIQFAILSEPSVPNTGAIPARALILINSGACRHVGPNRLYTPLARFFASKGYLVLRVDISGLGDSEPHTGEPEVAPYTPHALGDIQHWMDFLREQHAVEDIHLLGICTGGYHSFRAAVAGLPLKSVISINPVAFFGKEGTPVDLPLPEHQVVRMVAGYRRSLLDPLKWRKLMSGNVDLKLATNVFIRQLAKRMKRHIRILAHTFRIPLKHDLGRDLRTTCERSTRLSFIFSEGDPGLSILNEQAEATVNELQRMKKLAVFDVPGSDHTFSTEAARRALTETLLNSLEFGDVPPARGVAVKPQSQAANDSPPVGSMAIH